MKINRFNSIDLSDVLKEISDIFDISNKEYFSFGIDYNSVEPLIQDKFLDDGDFGPDWLVFIINTISEIIKTKDASENIILIKDNSFKNKVKNIKFKTMSLRLDDFTDIGLKYLEYELGFFIVWGIKEHSLTKISDFSGLIAPFSDGQAMLCIADKDDNILKYIENKLSN